MGDEALRIRDTALADARKTLDEREVAGHLSNLTKQSATMLASGYERDGEYWYQKDSAGKRIESTKIKHDDIDVTTQGALDYAQRNGLVGTRNGSRAIAKSLVDTGEARLSHIDYLAKQITEDGDRAAFIENTRAAAQSAGLDQLKYMTLNKKGEVDFAGVTYPAGTSSTTRDAAIDRIAGKISASKLSGLNKYTFDERDPIFVDTLGSKIVDIETRAPDRFKTELSSMGADAVEKMAKLVYASSMGRGKFTNEDAARQHYADLLNEARREHHG